MAVEFHDYSIEVKAELEDAVTAYLHEAAGELHGQTVRNSRQNNWNYGDIKATALWEFEVDEGEKMAQVGSPHEAGYWEEFGTGEHAANGDGRKGWWVYVEGGGEEPRRSQKYYTKEEALQLMAMLKSDGLDAHITDGHEPNRPLERAFTEKKSALKRRAEEILKGRMG